MSERVLDQCLPEQAPFVAPQVRRAANSREGARSRRPIGAAATAKASTPKGILRFVPLVALAVAALLVTFVFTRSERFGPADDDPAGTIEEQIGTSPEATAEAQPEPAWLRIDEPVPAFALDVPDLDGLPRLYEAARHTTGGGRDDVILVGGFAGQEAHLRLSAYRPGGEAVPPGSFFVDLVRRAGEAGLAVARSAIAVPLASKLGPIESADVLLSGEAGQRPCLAFRYVADAPAIRLSGWYCGSAQRPAERAALACLFDRFELVAPGEDKALADWFAGADQNRIAACAPPPIAAKPAKPVQPESDSSVAQAACQATSPPVSLCGDWGLPCFRCCRRNATLSVVVPDRHRLNEDSTPGQLSVSWVPLICVLCLRGHAMRRIVALSLTAVTLAALSATVAEAQTRRPRTLTVTPRSFLDPGNVVPVGSLSNYVLAGTVLAQPVWYGQPKQDYPLPHRFDVPGRNPFPMIEFNPLLDGR